MSIRVNDSVLIDEEDQDDTYEEFLDSVFDDMNNVDQSNNSELMDEENEDDAYEEFLEEEVLDYGQFVDRASGDPGHWKMKNAELIPVLHQTGKKPFGKETDC